MSSPSLFNAKGRVITEILGRNKYTNYKQALNEAIANSLDAKSTFVKVILKSDSIEILDNGIGMSESDLINRYFTVGERNLNSESRGLFGIGVCANAALGDLLTIESRAKGESKGIKAVVDFKEVEKFDAGNYKPDKWDVMEFKNNYSTYIKVERLNWSNIDENEVIKFLVAKHWPLLIDASMGVKIEVNGITIKATEPEGVEKYEFNNNIDFKIGNKIVPSTDLDCGHIEGVFYFKESGFDEPSIDVYVKNQRIDAYSGDQIDWLRVQDLSSPQGFRSRIKGIIKVDATDEEGIKQRSPLDRNILTLKSDRTAFFEESRAFKHLVAYLNEKSNGSILKLPNGGILRVINSEWYKNRGADIGKTQELINKLEPDLKKDLTKIFEEDKLNVEKGGDLNKKRRAENKNKDWNKSENQLFKCPQCDNILRVRISICKQWNVSNVIEKNKLRKEFWTCDTCGYILDPIKDKYKRGPLKGKEIFQVHLEGGFLTHILADALGRDGPRAFYIPEESTIKINAEHAMLIYSVKSSDESFKCYLLDSIIFAIAARKSKDTGINFELIYNKESAKINKVINLDEYEDTLSKLKINIQHKEKIFPREYLTN